MLGSDPTSQKTYPPIFSPKQHLIQASLSPPLSFLLSFMTRQLSPKAHCIIHKLFSQLIKDGRRQNVITICSKLHKDYNLNVIGGKRGEMHQINTQADRLHTSSQCYRSHISRQDLCFEIVKLFSSQPDKEGINIMSASETMKYDPWRYKWLVFNLVIMRELIATGGTKCLGIQLSLKETWHQSQSIQYMCWHQTAAWCPNFPHWWLWQGLRLHGDRRAAQWKHKHACRVRGSKG